MKKRHQVTVGAILLSLALRYKFLLGIFFGIIQLIENTFFTWLGAEKGFNETTVVLSFLLGYLFFYVVNDYENILKKVKKLFKKMKRKYFR
ncbi:MAG: hypothetical protein ACTSYD_02045 [Candidatus Heimdallarchaeaceae archaeon]